MRHLWVLLCLIGVTSPQPHHEAGSSLSCPDCGGHAHPFPDCLAQAPHACHPDEVCMIRYGGIHEATIHCHKADQCQAEVGGATVPCSTGGAEVHGQCQICCSDATCLSHTLPLINVSTTANVMALHCPASCPLDQAATCVTTGHLCHNQFCHLSKDTSLGIVSGKCSDKRDIAKCQQDMTSIPCNDVHHKCTVGCCENEDCVAGVINNGSAPTSLWQILNGQCLDVLDNGQCATLDTSQHLCGDRLSVRLCPRTCGLCSLFNASLCRDTVHSSTGCPGLVAASNICNTSLALSICPLTCHLCDQILEPLLQAALQGSGSITQAITQTLPPLPVTDVSAVNPTQALVTTQSTTKAPAVTQPITDAPAVTQPITDDLAVTHLVTNAPAMTQPITNAPAVTHPVTSIPVATHPVTDGPMMTSSHHSHASTSPVHHGHTGDTTLPADPSDTCRDSMQQMSCAEVTDVCASPLLVNYCQKFCGLCSSDSTTVSG